MGALAGWAYRDIVKRLKQLGLEFFDRWPARIESCCRRSDARLAR